MAFELRGLVESFYGPYYTFPQRDDMLRFLAARGFTTYLYGPKNDRYHRSWWRDPYPANLLARFGKTIALARSLGIDFAYALSPLSISYASPAELDLVRNKLRAFYNLGVRDFALFFDDSTVEFRHKADAARFGSVAEAQAVVANQINVWLTTLDSRCTLSLCPSEYEGVAPFGDYLHQLGSLLAREIDIFYTGPHTCCAAITAVDVDGFAEAVRRRPILWDNYPVNDLAMRPEMHLGPVRGRASDLSRAVKGVVVNPMLQPEASKIALATYAHYLSNPVAYAAGEAWEAALIEVAGEADAPVLRRFAENSLHSCLGVPEAKRLEQLTNEVVAALRGGAQLADVAALPELDAYLIELDQAIYYLATQMENVALRADLIAWIETMEHWHNAGRAALLVLDALERGTSYAHALWWLRDSLEFSGRLGRRVGAHVLRPLADLALAGVDAVESGRLEESTAGSLAAQPSDLPVFQLVERTHK